MGRSAIDAAKRQLTRKNWPSRVLRPSAKPGTPSKTESRMTSF